MKIESKLIDCPETGEVRIAVVARSRVDAAGIRKIFRTVAEANTALSGCPVLIDLRQGTHRMTYLDIYEALAGMDRALRSLENRIALLSASSLQQYDSLLVLSLYLLDHGLEADVFCEIDGAIEWLAQKKQPPVLH
jgi:hypothetical protein